MTHHVAMSRVLRTSRWQCHDRGSCCRFSDVVVVLVLSRLDLDPAVRNQVEPKS